MDIESDGLEHIPGFREQARDLLICLFIYYLGGFAPLRVVVDKFWPNVKTLRAAQSRIARLCQQKYLNRPTRFQWRTKPIPEPILYLGWRGIQRVAEHLGVVVEPPSNSSENQLKLFETALRKKGIRWVREPSWIMLYHNIRALDFRLAVEKSAEVIPSMFVDAWINESAFRASGDTIEYTLNLPRGKRKKMKRMVIPDGHFTLVYRFLDQDGVVNRSTDRFLLEIDGGTHHLERFGYEKVVPGFEYVVKSPEYKKRFGNNSGRWLVVTTGEVRMSNLMEKTEQVLREGAHLFLFSYFEMLKTENVLLDAVWWQGWKKREPKPIIDRTLLWGEDSLLAPHRDDEPALGSADSVEHDVSGSISL